MQLVVVLLNKLAHLFLCFFIWIKNMMIPFYWWQSLKRKAVMYGSAGSFVDLKAEANFSNGFSKIPMHMAFIFPDEDLINLDILTCLLIWSCICGIPNISLYDIHGRIKSFSKEIACSQMIAKYPLRFFEFGGSDFQDGNSGVVKVHLLDGMSGRPEFASMVQSVALSKDREKISPADIDAYFKDNFNFMNPDVAVVVGDAPVSSYGYPPWSLRLTEFYSMPKISPDVFTQLLRRYSKTEQRYGR